MHAVNDCSGHWLHDVSFTISQKQQRDVSTSKLQKCGQSHLGQPINSNIFTSHATPKRALSITCDVYLFMLQPLRQPLSLLLPRQTRAALPPSTAPCPAAPTWTPPS